MVTSINQVTLNYNYSYCWEIYQSPEFRIRMHFNLPRELHELGEGTQHGVGERLRVVRARYMSV